MLFFNKKKAQSKSKIEAVVVVGTEEEIAKMVKGEFKPDSKNIYRVGDLLVGRNNKTAGRIVNILPDNTIGLHKTSVGKFTLDMSSENRSHKEEISNMIFNNIIGLKEHVESMLGDNLNVFATYVYKDEEDVYHFPNEIIYGNRDVHPYDMVKGKWVGVTPKRIGYPDILSATIDCSEEFNSNIVFLA